MTDNSDLCVEVRDQDIIVTMPGTSLRVVYRKPHRGSESPVSARSDCSKWYGDRSSRADHAMVHLIARPKRCRWECAGRPREESANF